VRTRSTTTPAAKRATATSGPKINHAAAAAGNDRADGPVPHPHPRYGTIRGFHRSARTSKATAKMNGVLSSNVEADVTSNTVSTLRNHAERPKHLVR
jgi:hypothetical protein